MFLKKKGYYKSWSFWFVSMSSLFSLDGTEGFRRRQTKTFDPSNISMRQVAFQYPVSLLVPCHQVAWTGGCFLHDFCLCCWVAIRRGNEWRHLVWPETSYGACLDFPIGTGTEKPSGGPQKGECVLPESRRIHFFKDPTHWALF